LRLSIGILADTSLQLHSLRRVVDECGHTICQSLSLEQLKTTGIVLALQETKVDAWIFNVDLAILEALETDNQEFHACLENINVPIIFGDDVVPPPSSEGFVNWSRRLKQKIERLAGTIKLQQTSTPCAQYLWVLGASTGGPEAVKEFLSLLPASLGVAFIYVQHIDTEFDGVLAQIMSRDSHYPAYLVEHGDIIRENAVAVVRSDRHVEVLDNGTFTVSDKSWRGPYSPSIDQVAANVARVFKEKSGIIIFSGMGGDGASSCRLIKQQGGTIWVQSPETCACSSMPDEALATNVVSVIGSPKQLAQQFKGYFCGDDGQQKYQCAHES
jgi:chemosensory pili system protein ChpB (putative protein-glutamate methylesterase)